MSAAPGTGARPARTLTLTALEKELFHARDAKEWAYAADLERRIAALSQGSGTDPRRETTGTRRKR